MSLRSWIVPASPPNMLGLDVRSEYQLCSDQGHTSIGVWRNLDRSWGDAGDKTKGAGGVLGILLPEVLLD